MKQTLIFVTWLILYIVQREKTIVSPIAEKREQKAAEDLAHFIELMTSVKIPVINKHDA